VFANTSTDPYGTAGGGARPNSGTVAVYFFPTSGNPFCLTTGGAATLPTTGGTGAVTCAVATNTSAFGLGLSTGGVVASGASWVVLGSEIFKQITGAPTVFNGYAMAISNFSYGHATSFVADATFSGKFTAGGPGLILNNPSVLSRTASLSAGQAEGLNH
jgi:hypothetical protein